MEAPTGFRRYVPRAELVSVVEHYWTVVAPAPPTPVRAVLIPNGRATVQLCLGTPGTRTAVGGLPSRNADVLLPATTGPFVLEQVGASHYVGVQFTPWGARELWPRCPHEPAQLTDIAGSLPDRDALIDDPVAALDGWLFARFRGPGRNRALIETIVRHIDADPAGLGVRDLPTRVGASTSTIFREFVGRTGLSPKRYISIMRFRGFTDALLAAGHGDSGALLSALSGYYDQSHAGRDFARHTGMTPRRFMAAYDGIARLMTDPSKSGAKRTS